MPFKFNKYTDDIYDWVNDDLLMIQKAGEKS